MSSDTRDGLRAISLAVVDNPGVNRVGLDLAAMVFGAALALAIRLTAKALIRAVLRWFE